MPIFKTAGKLIFYAHVPKCGGSAVEAYLGDRFGSVAFQNISYLSLPEAARWSRTSPQHIDVASLDLLFPPDFFDFSFSIVRHPISRMVSAFHFQQDVERSIPKGTGFSEWLEDLREIMEETPFAHDNHIRPMNELVPQGAHIFHLEHGLDALVPWLDTITGDANGPRAVPHINKQGDYTKSKNSRVTPTPAEVAQIVDIYGADFKRFGYSPDQKAPLAAAPELSERQKSERDAALKAMNDPIFKIKNRLRKALG